MRKIAMLAGALILAVCGSASSEGFRNIASLTEEVYDDDSWRLEVTDVFLARIVPALTAVVKVTGVYSEERNQHLFYLRALQPRVGRQFQLRNRNHRDSARTEGRLVPKARRLL